MLSLCVTLCSMLCAQMLTDAGRGVLNPSLELKLQAVLNHSVWELGTELGSLHELS